MEKDKNIFLMETFIKEIMKKGSLMEKVDINGEMVVIMMEIFIRVIEKDREFFMRLVVFPSKVTYLLS